VDALILAQAHMSELRGQVFNIGGGSENTISLIELIELIGELDVECNVDFDDWRTGDQRYYVSDTRKFGTATGWSARVGVRAGVAFPGEALACAMNIFARARIEPGQDVAIVGVGFLGSILTKLAADAGARVIGISRRAFALETAQRFGAAHVLPLAERGEV